MNKSSKLMLLGIALIISSNAYTMQCSTKKSKLAFLGLALASLCEPALATATSEYPASALVMPHASDMPVASLALLEPGQEATYDLIFEKCEMKLDHDLLEFEKRQGKLKEVRKQFEQKLEKMPADLSKIFREVYGKTWQDNSVLFPPADNYFSDRGLSVQQIRGTGSNRGDIEYPSTVEGLQKIKDALFALFQNEPTQQNKKLRNAILNLEKEIKSQQKQIELAEEELEAIRIERDYAIQRCNKLQNPDTFQEEVEAMREGLE